MRSMYELKMHFNSMWCGNAFSLNVRWGLTVCYENAFSLNVGVQTFGLVWMGLSLNVELSVLCEIVRNFQRGHEFYR